MSDGFVYRYETGWSAARAADHVRDLEKRGFSLGHMKTGRITWISRDEGHEGEQVEADRLAILCRAAVETEPEFSFQYWIDVDIDVLCTVMRLGPTSVVQRFYINGLNTEQ